MMSAGTAESATNGFYNRIYTSLEDMDFPDVLQDIGSYVLLILAIGAFCIVLGWIIQRIIIRRVSRWAKNSKSVWNQALAGRKVFQRLGYLIPLTVFYHLTDLLPSGTVWMQRIVFCCIILLSLLVIGRFFDAVNDVYCTFEVSKVRPIKGYLQLGEILCYIIGIIVMLSVLLNRSPWLLLSGIGAATAVLILIFQNSILGLVGGIQITSNDLLQIGDWIEFPKYSVDGEVLEVTLQIVKVQNFDKTIATIPTYSFVSESFKNWRGMVEAGGRRIKRSVNIDVKSIRFVDQETLERFKEIQLIQAYIEEKEKEIQDYNSRNQTEKKVDGLPVNGRHMTNIGVFRAYIQEYLKQQPGIHKGMMQLVRQLPPTEKGLPIEIYAFTNDTDWAAYESIQSDLFDHILAVVSAFDLKVFQEPTGYFKSDINSI